MNLLAWRRAAGLLLTVVWIPLIRTHVGPLSLSRRNSKYLKNPVNTQTLAHDPTHTRGDMLGFGKTYTDTDMVGYVDGRSGRKVSSKQEMRQNLRKQNRQKSRGENEFKSVQIAETSTKRIPTSTITMTTKKPTTTVTTSASPNVSIASTTEDFDTMLRSVLDYYREEATTEASETRFYMNDRRSISDYEEDYDYLEKEDRRLKDKTMPVLEKSDKRIVDKNKSGDERKQWRKLKRVEWRGKASNEISLSEPSRKVRLNKRKIAPEKMQKINARREMRKTKRKPDPEPTAIDYIVTAKPGERSQVRRIKRKEERNRNKSDRRRNRNKNKNKKYLKPQKFYPEYHQTYHDTHRADMHAYIPKYNIRDGGSNVKLERKAERQRKRQKSKERGNEGRNLKPGMVIP